MSINFIYQSKFIHMWKLKSLSKNCWLLKHGKKLRQHFNSPWWNKPGHAEHVHTPSIRKEHCHDKQTNCTQKDLLNLFFFPSAFEVKELLGLVKKIVAPIWRSWTTSMKIGAQLHMPFGRLHLKIHICHPIFHDIISHQNDSLESFLAKWIFL